MADINGIELATFRLVSPQGGAISVDRLSFADDSDDFETLGPGLDVLTIEGLAVNGTFDGGQFAEQRLGQFVGGADGWGSDVEARGYHNDAGVKASTVVSDLATAVGETVDVTGLGDRRLGVDFARGATTATATLNRIAPDWYVGLDGVTVFAARTSELAAAETYRVLDFDSHQRVADLDPDDPSTLAVGDQIDVNGSTETIRTLTIEQDGDKLTTRAWVGGDLTSLSDFGDRLRDVIRTLMPTQLHGIFRYRVAGVNQTRFDLQPVSTNSGLPDLSSVEMWTAPGIHGKLALGVNCGVQFLDGDAAQPVITAVGGQFQANHEPDNLDLGGPGGTGVVRVGDLGTVFLPAVIPVSGTVGGAPFVGTMTITSAVTAVMQTASLKVRSR